MSAETWGLWLAAFLVVVDLTVRITAIIVIPRNRRPTAAMAWLLAVFFLPYIGVVLFLLIGNPRLPRARRRKQDQINEYIREWTGIEVTAKDFRTWHATVTAAVTLATAEPARTATARRKRNREAVVAASDLLGNTPSVARSAYVDPRVLDLYEAGTVLDPVPRGTDAVDRAVAALLTQ